MILRRWKPRQRSFLFWLLTIQCIAVLPVLCLAAWAVYTLGQRNQDLVLADLQGRVHATADALNREAGRARIRMRRIATADDFRQGRTDAMPALVVQTLADFPWATRVAALGPDGTPWFSFDRDGRVAPRLSDLRQPTPVAGGERIRIAPLERGAGGPADEIDFLLPAALGSATARYDLRLSVRRDGVGDILRAQAWPATWTAAVMDQNLTIVARSRDEATYAGQPASPSVQRLVQANAKGLQLARTKDGIESLTVIQPIEGTPWWLAAGIPRDAVDRAANGPLRQVLMGSAVFILLGVATAFWLSRRLQREMDLASRGTGTARGIVKEFGSIRARHLMLHNDLVGMVQLVDRRAVWCNPALETIFGCEPGGLDGAALWQHGEDPAAFDDFARRADAALARGESFREQLRMVRRDGSRIRVDASGVALPDGSSLWMLLDVTAQQAEHDRMAGLAFRDALTGLPNRAAWDERLAQEIAAAARLGRPLAVCMLDLNGFKAINDRWGHPAGDALLRAVAVRLQGCVRPYDMVARFGGDEFAILLPHLTRTDDVCQAVERIRTAVRASVDLGATVCTVEAAVGVAFHPTDGAEAAALLAVADARMYTDKAEGKGLRS